jgi:hypothetical protein
MRRREPPRVVGPYKERGKWRIVLVENGKRKSIFLDTEAEALRAKAELERSSVRPASRRLGDVLDLWGKEQLRRGTSKPESIHQASSVQNAATARVLSVLDAPLVQGEEAARALAERLRARLDGATRAHLARLLVEIDGADPYPA